MSYNRYEEKIKEWKIIADKEIEKHRLEFIKNPKNKEEIDLEIIEAKIKTQELLKKMDESECGCCLFDGHIRRSNG